MSVFYLLMIIFLFSLAIVDLWVGVSYDAVNFLNSAVGSRVTSLRRIILVAAVGVFVGKRSETSKQSLYLFLEKIF